MTTRVYSDGGVHGKNTRSCSTWGSYYVEGHTPEPVVVECGIGSNNTAEYNTLIEALKYCEGRNITDAEVFIDSQLVYYQTLEEWRIKDDRLKELCYSVRQLLYSTHAKLHWVRREEIVKVLGH